MAKVWKFTADTAADAAKPAEHRYYLVGVDHEATARLMLESLGELKGARIEAHGEASAELVTWLGGVKDGKILCVAAVT